MTKPKEIAETEAWDALPGSVTIYFKEERGPIKIHNVDGIDAGQHGGRLKLQRRGKVIAEFDWPNIAGYSVSPLLGN